MGYISLLISHLFANRHSIIGWLSSGTIYAIGLLQQITAFTYLSILLGVAIGVFATMRAREDWLKKKAERKYYGLNQDQDLVDREDAKQQARDDAEWKRNREEK